jgi:serine/threonine protein kinase
MPKRIGKYEITAEIGRGGFSRVYRGFDPNMSRPIAIKVSTRESDPEHLSRFRNEASEAGNLQHENIVTIHDYGDDDGVPYLVMELLEGRDLFHIMRDGPKLSLLEKMQIMSQVGQGLQRAHENGVVHRDLKPANVMVLTDGKVKILDFGIARMTGEVGGLTQSGFMAGTPLYMSPEQLTGGDADALCDVWAFGVLYFELLTGQHPFLSQDNTRLIRNITIVNPPSVHSLTRGVPEGLAQVIRRALAKDRRRRYQRVEDALVDTYPILGLLQRGQISGLATEAQSHRNGGQSAAAREVESVSPPEATAAPIAEEKRAEVLPPPLPPPFWAVPETVLADDEPESIPPDEQLASAAAASAVSAIQIPATPSTHFASVQSEIAEPAEFAQAAAAPAAAPIEIVLPAPAMEPAPSSTHASGAAAAIAAAVAAAKARQAEEEQEERERKEAEGEAAPSAPAIKATPLVVKAAPTARVAAPPPTTATMTRTENGSAVFVTDDPLVVKRPASSVLAQRIQAMESLATPANPVPAHPPTRLPGTKAIPPRVPRNAGAATESKVATPNEVPVESRPTTSENLPMRRPPSEVYAKGRRRRSSSNIFTEKQKTKKPFPWAVVGFVVAVTMAAAALVLFTLSAPKYATTMTLLPEKTVFSWKPVTAFPPEQLLTLKGGTAGSSFTASSNDDWLIVTPETEEANNRSWQIKVEPDKLGATTPGTTTGWIDVTSAEGFKTQAEVSLKIAAADAAPAAPAAKVQKTAPAPTPKAEKAGNGKDEKTPAPVATITPAVTKPLAGKTLASTDPAKTEIGKAASATTTTSAAPAKKTEPEKAPTNEGVEIN